jgi:exopolyphosphatase/guanosine-5'-triphosphate,3'-diphosphate pyrophosphatase
MLDLENIGNSNSTLQGDGDSLVQPVTGCIERIAAYDTGSSTTKFLIADVDKCLGKVTDRLYQTYTELHYAQDLKASGNSTFSWEVQDQGIALFKKLKDIAEKQFGELPVKHCGVATAAFRKAHNGENFAKKIEEETGITFKIISQEEEGNLAFYGAMLKADAKDLRHAVVWDIGGGSMQLIGMGNDNQIAIHGNELGSVAFQAELINSIKPTTISPNPMNEDEINQAIRLGLQLLGDGLTLPGRQDDQVYGVGNIHNTNVQHHVNRIYEEQAMCKAQPQLYSREEVSQAVNTLKGKTDEEIMPSMAGIVNLEFARGQLSNLILVLAAMEKLGIFEVKTLPVSNLDGILARSC